MKKLLPLVCLLAVLWCSCKKNSADQPQQKKTDTLTAAITPGALTGTVSPATAVTTVTAGMVVNGQFKSFQANPDIHTGIFKFTGLSAGSYTLSFTVAPGYVAPVNQTVTITDDQTLDAGTITIAAATTTTAQTGTISGTVTQPAGLFTIIALNQALPYKYNYGSLDTKTGKFLIGGLSAGTYLIDYVTSSSSKYYAPATTGVVVTAGQNTDVGTITIADALAGSISGTVTPAGSVAAVTATSTTYGISYRAVPDAGGNFKIAGLTYDTYDVSATPVAGSGLYAPYRRSITLTNGQDLAMGNIGLTAAAPPVPVTCQVDGTALATASGIIDSYYTSSQLVIRTTLNGYTLAIMLAGVTGPGDYTCNSTSGNLISLHQLGLSLNDAIRLDTWDTKYPGAGGTVKVVSIDPATKTITGTFSATVTGSLMLVSSSRTISSGTFTVSYQ